ncbi:MAG TPA: hypothetical protein PK177_19105, partial [Burkholderiaceae bacterium]|nr:hypothetical protein [Burkholderiaceae bacterium]
AASAAGKRFWQTHVKRQRQDDVDALTDEVMQTYEEVFSGRESGRRIAQAAARAKDLTTKYALSFVDADYLDGMHPDDADYIGRILGKIAVGTELAAPEAKELARVFDDPASGLTEKALVRIGVDGPGVAKWVRSMARPLSTTAGIEQEAPVMARGRDAAAELAATTGVQSLDESGASDATTSDAEAEAAERGADQTEDVLRDFNNGINERATAGERLAPVDRLNSIRQSMRAIEARTKDNERLSEEDRAHARAEYVTLRTEARQLRDDLRSKIEAKNGVITRNDSSAKASQFFASRQRNPGYVALRNTVEVTTKAGETKQQPQMLDLGMLIMRQQAAMRAEGSTDENIDAKAALLRGLTEAADAGLEVDYNAFKVGSIVNSQTGREILKITPRLRKQLRGAVLPEWSPWGGEMGSPEAEAIRNDPDVAAAARHELTRLELKKSPSKKDQARAADLEAMLARAPEERTQSRVVEGRETANVDPIDHGDYASDLRRQGARAVPPGVQDQGTEQGQRRRRKDGRGFEPTTKADTDVRKDEFIPQEGVVADVRFNSPHEQQLRTWMKERSPADPDNPGRRLVLTPAQRAAIDRKYGELIGAAALAAEAEAGTISPKRLENELKRLTDPKSGLAKRYLERAYKGELPGGETVASVRHTPTDAEKRATGKHADRADGDGHPDNDATADRIDRTTEALRDSGEGNRPATRPIKRSKPVPKPAPKKRVVKKRELTTPEEAVNAHAKTLAELKPRLVTDRAREAADILTGGTFKLEDGSAVAIPEATLQRAVAMARRIADGWSTFPENGGFAAQSDWMRGEGRDVPQPAELYDLVNEAYQAAEAVKRYGPPSPLKAAEAAGKVFAPAALADWAAKRSVVDDVTSMEDLCLATSEHTVWVLRAHGYRAARAHASVTIPGSTDGRQMGHYAAVVEIDGQRFIVDQPQGELFAPTGDGNMVKIKQRAFTPRFIPASEAAAAYDTPGVEFHMPANVELSTLPVADFAAVPEAPKAPKAKPGTNRISADLRARAAKADDDTLRQMVSQVEARIRGGDASEAALDAMRDDRAHLLGLLSQRAEAANAAAVESLTTSTEHDVKAESTLVRAWLKLLGIKHPLVVEDLTKHMIGGDRAAAEAGLTSGRLGGQHAIGRGQKADKARIRLNPHLHGAERVSVLAHEVGHHVVFHELAKALKRPFTDVVRMSDADLLAAADDPDQARLRAVSRRPRLSEPVSDAIVQRGDRGRQ